MDVALSLGGKAHAIMCIRSKEPLKDGHFITLGPLKS